MGLMKRHFGEGQSQCEPEEVDGGGDTRPQMEKDEVGSRAHGTGYFGVGAGVCVHTLVSLSYIHLATVSWSGVVDRRGSVNRGM